MKDEESKAEGERMKDEEGKAEGERMKDEESKRKDEESKDEYRKTRGVEYIEGVEDLVWERVGEGRDVKYDGKARDLKERTKQFALQIIHMTSRLPKTMEAQVIGKQIMRSGTSVGAQYREAQRSKSDADFISKIEGSLQELDETSYWLELLDGAAILRTDELKALCDEANQLTAIFVSMVRKVKARKNS